MATTKPKGPRSRLDPTRTGRIRRAFAARLRKGFAAIRRKIRQLIVDQDVLGITPPSPGRSGSATGPGPIPTRNQANPANPSAGSTRSANARSAVANAGDWGYDTSAGKLKRFRHWLRQQQVTELPGDAAIEEYIAAGYRFGAVRAFNDIRRNRAAQAGEAPPLPATAPMPGTPDAAGDWVRGRMSKGPTVEKVKLLASRTFSEMEDVSAKMATKMSRLLADGMVAGWSVQRIASALQQVVGLDAGRALAVARTELIRAHAEGQLDALDAAGEAEVEALVEFDAVGDYITCARCKKLEDRKEPFTVAEARGVIPVHPNCRCAWVPLKRRKGARR